MKIEQLGYNIYTLLSPIYGNVDYTMSYCSLKFAFIWNE